MQHIYQPVWLLQVWAEALWDEFCTLTYTLPSSFEKEQVMIEINGVKLHKSWQ